MLISPEATVHAEIARRLELAGTYRRYAPVRARREWPHLRDLFGRRHRTPRPVRPALLATAGRHHVPLSPTVAFR
jgi:hypothetical protein